MIWDSWGNSWYSSWGQSWGWNEDEDEAVTPSQPTGGSVAPRQVWRGEWRTTQTWHSTTLGRCLMAVGAGLVR